jgi:hypothetical protein
MPIKKINADLNGMRVSIFSLQLHSYQARKKEKRVGRGPEVEPGSRKKVNSSKIGVGRQKESGNSNKKEHS